MAISKLILNGEVQMDVTSDTVEANKLLEGETATKNDGTKITGTFVAPDPVISSLSVTPTESAQTFNEASISGYKPVTVGAIASDYVGSAIPMRSAVNLTGLETYSGYKVQAQQGYYSQTASYNISAASINISGPYFTYSLGYFSGAVNIITSGYTKQSSYSFSQQLSTLSSQTITPSSESQYIPANRWLTGSQTIAAISSTYIGSAIPLRTNLSLSSWHQPAPNTNYEYLYFEGNAPYGYYSQITTSTTFMTISAYEASTIVPSTESRLLLMSSKFAYARGSVYLDAIPSSYIIPSGTYSVTENGTYDIGSYASVDVSVAGGGDNFEDALVMRTLTSYENSRVSYVGQGAFAYISSISVNFPNATLIQNYAFYSAKILSASFPNVTQIGASAFDSAVFSTVIYSMFPNVKSISSYAFRNARISYRVEFPEVEYIGDYGFYDCGTNFGSWGFSMPKLISIGRYAFGSNSNFGNQANGGNIIFPSLTTIGEGGFNSCYTLQYISIQNVISMGALAFNYCSSLARISLPIYSAVIPRNCFRCCGRLSDVNIPNTTGISSFAFQYCNSLQSAIFSEVSYISGSAFQYCYHLSILSIPKCRGISLYAFDGCSSLTEITLPECLNIYTYAFRNCRGLMTASLPQASQIASSAFYSCYSLSTVFMPKCLYIDESAFASCSALMSVYLLGSSLASLNNTTAFTATPMHYSMYIGYFGSIFVPASLYDSYITAANWSYYSSRIVGLTDEQMDPIIHRGNVVHAGQMIDTTVSYGMYIGEAQFSSNLPTGSSYVLFDTIKYKDTNGSYHLIANTPGVSFIASVNELYPHKSTGDTTFTVGVAYDHAAFMWQLPSSIADVSEVVCDYTICEYNA